MNSPLLVILGPTASGKSGLSIHLAQEFAGEVVNCDSVQVYRHLNIGTSKLSRQEQRGVPHHMLDCVEPDAWFTAGEYLSLGRQVLGQIRERGRLPIVVGGTGFYLRALLEGLFNGPGRSDELRRRLSQRAERKGTIHLHRLLQKVDPRSAARIAPNDQPKLTRALEVFFLTSKPLSAHFDAGRDPLREFAVLKIGLNPERQCLYAAINRRVDQMFESGLVNEVQSLLVRGFSPSLKSLQSLGYAQVIQHLRGEITLAESIELTKRATRQYAKRQLTWFRKEAGVTWFNGFGADLAVKTSVDSAVRSFLEQQSSP